VGADEEDVVARLGDPAKARLPSELASDSVELQAVDERYERVELRVDVVRPYAGRESPFGKRDFVVVRADVYEPAAMRPDTQRAGHLTGNAIV
jgi:hypothetical protein